MDRTFLPKPKYGGAFYKRINDEVQPIYITKVINNPPYTIVFWNDGTKTTSKCSDKDTFDLEKGVMLCTMKKMFGGEYVHDLLVDWASQSQIIWELKNVRKQHRE